MDHIYQHFRIHWDELKDLIEVDPEKLEDFIENRLDSLFSYNNDFYCSCDERYYEDKFEDCIGDLYMAATYEVTVDNYKDKLFQAALSVYFKKLCICIDTDEFTYADYDDFMNQTGKFKFLSSDVPNDKLIEYMDIRTEKPWKTNMYSLIKELRQYNKYKLQECLGKLMPEVPCASCSHPYNSMHEYNFDGCTSSGERDRIYEVYEEYEDECVGMINRFNTIYELTDEEIESGIAKTARYKAYLEEKKQLKQKYDL